jgi:hypothetical protein
MRLKGTCKITLKDAKTGRIEHQEEHSNTITPALQNILEKNMSGTVNYAKLFPLFNKLLGGICCWNGTLDATDIFLPKQENAVLTSHAGLHQYEDPADDRSRGQLVSAQLQTNGYKWTWEWGTTQGNGNISDVTLVHPDVGDYYEQSHNDFNDAFCPVEDISNYIINAYDFQNNDQTSPTAQSLPQRVGNAQQKRMPLGFYGDLNHVVSIELTEDEQYQSSYGGDWRKGHVTIYISKFAGTGTYLWNEVGEPDYERKIDVPLTFAWQQANFEVVRGAFHVAYDEEIKHFYILWGGTPAYVDYDPMPDPPFTFRAYPVSSSLHYIDVDLETGTISTMKTITNRQHQLMFRFLKQSYIPLQLQVVEGHIIMPLYYVPKNEDGKYQYLQADSTASCGVRLDLRSSTIKDYVEELDIAYGDNSYNGTGNINLGNGRSMWLNHYVEKKASKDLILSDLDSWFYTKAMSFPEFFPNAWHTGRIFTASSVNSLVQFCIVAGNGVQDWNKRIRGALLNKMYKASAFHLQDRVIKTNTHIMTVEYTLTQEGEES